MKNGEFMVDCILRFCKDKAREGYGEGFVSYDACLNCPLSRQERIKAFPNEVWIWCSLDRFNPHKLIVRRKKG